MNLDSHVRDIVQQEVCHQLYNIPDLRNVIQAGIIASEKDPELFKDYPLEAMYYGY